MVVGANGVNGMNVQYLVEVLTKRDPVYVIVRPQNLAEMIVRSMDPRTQKQKDVTKIHAQVSQMSL